MRRIGWGAALILFLPLGGVQADVIHFKDGRTIQVDSWHYSGDQIVFERAGGTVTVPRSMIERVEAAPPGPGTGKSSSPAPAASPPPSPSSRGTAMTAPSDEAVRSSIDALKSELRTYPLRREVTSRQIATLLTVLGNRARERNDTSAAEGLYREALTYDSRFLPALINLSSTYLAEGKDLYARAQIHEALVAFPKDPDLHALLGEVYYEQENLQDAISEWETSLALRDDAQVARRLEKARREFAVDRDFVRSEAPHFTLRYEGGGSSSSLLDSSIRDYLEEEFDNLSSRFLFVPLAPIVVLLYPSRDFHDVTEMPSWVGGLFDGKIRIPIGGLSALTSEVRSVLLHELTHAFVFGKTRGNCPRWLQEGLAQLMEGKVVRPSEERNLAREFAASSGGAWSTQFSYPASLSFTRYLVDHFRFESLTDALEKMASGMSAEKALGEVTRENFVDLQEAWGRDLAGRAGGKH